MDVQCGRIMPSELSTLTVRMRIHIYIYIYLLVFIFVAVVGHEQRCEKGRSFHATFHIPQVMVCVEPGGAAFCSCPFSYLFAYEGYEQRVVFQTIFSYIVHTIVSCPLFIHVFIPFLADPVFIPY